ncbi:MAG: outer membrane lipoprotein OprI [Gammaproteobacteria bacterium]|nr:outer membrane lipoprotein OprI [Gammaproteobacteria bacterium]
MKRSKTILPLAFASVLVLSGCATTDQIKQMQADITKAQESADAALAAAREADNKAEAAMEAANVAQQSADECSERCNRIMQKAMQK